ncbi:MAG: cation transporter, partial [Gemmatimonadaceae bacterium]
IVGGRHARNGEMCVGFEPDSLEPGSGRRPHIFLHRQGFLRRSNPDSVGTVTKTLVQSTSAEGVPSPDVDESQFRARLVRRGRTLSYVTLGYNVGEGAAAIIAGALAGSVALVGFGIDSLIEVTSSVAALWRFRADFDPDRRERVERLSLRAIGACFLALSAYLVVDAGFALWMHEAPRQTLSGMVIAALSVVIMPILARAKRKVAVGLGSRALRADAMQTNLCMYLSAIVLGGLALNTIFGWWWADAVAALVMTPIVAREGFEGLRDNKVCDAC